MIHASIYLSHHRTQKLKLSYSTAYVFFAHKLNKKNANKNDNIVMNCNIFYDKPIDKVHSMSIVGFGYKSL